MKRFFLFLILLSLLFVFDTQDFKQSKALDIILFNEDFDLEPKESVFYNWTVENDPMIIQVNVTLFYIENQTNWVNFLLSNTSFLFTIPYFEYYYELSISDTIHYGILLGNPLNLKCILLNQSSYYVNLYANNIWKAQGHIIIKDITEQYLTGETTTTTGIKISTPLTPLTGETTINKTGFLIQPISLLIAITIFIRRRKKQ